MTPTGQYPGGRRAAHVPLSPRSPTTPLMPCANPACGERVPASRLACPRDWRRLPTPLQNAVGRAWGDRCNGVPGSTAAHIAAKRAAVTWYQGNP